MRITACVDLDGTLAYYDGWKGIQHIGQLLVGAKEFMDELSKFADITIFTCRCHKDVYRDDVTESKIAVEKWLDENEIPYNHIYTEAGKPVADIYIDDKGFELGPHATENEFKMAIETIKDSFGL